MNQFGRRCDLIVSDSGGSGLDLSQLRIVFHVVKEDAQTPNSARIKVYGVAPETAARIKKEFVDVILQAGYEENYGVIFRGNIKDVRTGRENGVDTFLEISGGDGDAEYAFGIVNKTIAAGASQNEIVEATGIAPNGYVPNLGGTKLPRGKVMYGMKRDVLRESAKSTGTTWSIQDGKLQFMPLTQVLPGQAVVLNSQTGLIGTPEQTTKGIKGKALLNPLLKIGGRVLINERDVAAIKLKSEVKAEEADKEPAKIAADGQYRLIKVDFKGDTRGQDWYADFVCLDVDASAPADKKVKK